MMMPGIFFKAISLNIKFYPLKTTFCLVFLLSCTLFTSCEKHRLNKLQGGWLVVAAGNTPSHELKYFHHITFDCEEFRMQRQVISLPVCDTNTVFDIYIKGTYKLDGKTISLEGTLMDSTYMKPKTSACEPQGSYQKKFIWDIRKDLLVLKEEGGAEEKFSKVNEVGCD